MVLDLTHPSPLLTYPVRLPRSSVALKSTTGENYTYQHALTGTPGEIQDHLRSLNSVPHGIQDFALGPAIHPSGDDTMVIDPQQFGLYARPRIRREAA